MRTIRVIAWITLLAIPSFAQEMPLRQLYSDILSDPSRAGLPKADDIFAKVNEVTVGALSKAEVSAVLPLALQCIKSTNVEVRADGFAFFLSADLRPDSAMLLTPFIDDFGKLIESGDHAARRTLLYMLGSMQPKLPPKAIALLDAHLQESGNSNQETLTIAASLIKAAPADESTLHKVLLVASNRSDPELTNGVLRQLGLSKTKLPEAVAFISANLNQDDVGLRTSAVDAASRLDLNTRSQLSSQLSRIAADSKEPQNLRKQASEALKQ